ncbi:hypothetical protein ACFO6R_10915 [Eubacterium multiforme]|uniref:Uncharacterized protein n=1 Tax=Eubacterium multiforme TaxID=83339 RepID=A0ABT9UVE7_9FIRM|nr:hypothetical protein [Eubacterium multiforme]MDQ0150306.1 hypothetical protein [Eubacterium multiforme]
MKKRLLISFIMVLIIVLGIKYLGLKTFLNKYEVKRNIDNTRYTSSYIIFNKNLNLDNKKEKLLIEKIIKEEINYSENNFDKKSKYLAQSEIVFRTPNAQYMIGVNNKIKKLEFLGKVIINKNNKTDRKYIEKDANLQDILLNISKKIKWTYS